VRVFLVERELEMTINIFHLRNCDHENFPSITNSQQTTRVVLIQASAYITAFILTLTFPLIRWFRDLRRLDCAIDYEIDLIDVLCITILPLQGFFNFFIFVAHKVYNYQQVHKNVSTCEVLRLLLCTCMEEPLYLSRLTIIKLGEDEDENFVEFSVEDEVESSVIRYGMGLDVSDGDSVGGEERSKSQSLSSFFLSNELSEMKPASSVNDFWDVSSTGISH